MGRDVAFEPVYNLLFMTELLKNSQQFQAGVNPLEANESFAEVTL
jgi:hypothetical protein